MTECAIGLDCANKGPRSRSDQGSVGPLPSNWIFQYYFWLHMIATEQLRSLTACNLDPFICVVDEKFCCDTPYLNVSLTSVIGFIYKLTMPNNKCLFQSSILNLIHVWLRNFTVIDHGILIGWKDMTLNIHAFSKQRNFCIIIVCTGASTIPVMGVWMKRRCIFYTCRPWRYWRVSVLKGFRKMNICNKNWYRWSHDS